MNLHKMMTDHPNSVGESYFGHMAFALNMSRLMFLAAGAAFVHALLPFMFETTASGMMARLNDSMHHRGKDERDQANVPVGSL